MSERLLTEYKTPENVCAALGYFPGSILFKFKDTHGIPLVLSAHEALKAGWKKIDWDGARIAAARCGTNIDADIAEAKRELALNAL